MSIFVQKVHLARELYCNRSCVYRTSVNAKVSKLVEVRIQEAPGLDIGDGDGPNGVHFSCKVNEVTVRTLIINQILYE